MVAVDATPTLPRDETGHIHSAALFDESTGLFYFPRSDANGSQRVLLVDTNGDPLVSLGNDAVEDNTAAAAAVLGATTDAAVETDANGTISGKLRGAVKMLASVIHSAAGAIKIGGATAVGAAPTTNPLHLGALGFDGNIYAIKQGVPDDSASAGDSVLQVGSRLSAFDAVNNLWKRVRFDADTGGMQTMSRAGRAVPYVVTLHSGSTANGNGTAIDVQGYASIVLEVSGIGGATINWEVAGDLGTWFSCNGYNWSGGQIGGGVAVSVSSNGLFIVNCNGHKSFRARISGYSSGTIVVTAHVQVQAQPLPDVVGAGGYDTDGTSLGSLRRFVAADLRMYNGANAVRYRAVDTLKTNQSTATATTGDLTLWTPTSGKKFRLRSLRGRVSNAGRYEARDGTGTVIAYMYIEANVWKTLLDMDANGYLSAAANNSLLIRNQSGGNSDMDFIASGNEE